MKAILIDPKTKTISEVEHDGDYRDIKRLIEIDSPITTVRINNKNVLYLDDEGLLKDDPGPFFGLRGYPQPLAGKGLILGVDEMGESIATTFSLEEVKLNVSWLDDIQFDGFDQIPDGTMTDHPILGRIPVVGSTPRFSRRQREDV